MRRSAGGSGMIWHAMTSRHATSARSNSRPHPRAIDGRTTRARTQAPTMRGMVDRKSRPANAKSVQAARATSARGWPWRLTAWRPARCDGSPRGPAFPTSPPGRAIASGRLTLPVRAFSAGPSRCACVVLYWCRSANSSICCGRSRPC
jgi:hypothetical protein